MKKGHLFLCLILFFLMIFIPALAVKGDEQPNNNILKAPITSKSDTFLMLKKDGTVTEIYDDEYIFGVVAAEMPLSYPDEALKAQAISSYTLACQRRQIRRGKSEELNGADITADSNIDQGFITRAEAKEKWGSKADEYEKKLDDIIKSVKGITVKYNGEFAETLYHCVSGGRTESAENVWGVAVPYLLPVQSVGDLLSSDYSSTVSISHSEFIEKLNSISKKGDLTFSENSIGNRSCSESGTVLSQTLCGEDFSGKDLRSAFGLRSANFDISDDGTNITFTVRGYGHLVGMSQNGAKVMAEQGGTYKEILLWYYPGCEIS